METKALSGHPPATELPAAQAAPVSAAAAVSVDDVELAELAQAAKDFASASLASGTRVTYAKHWNTFVAWCAKRDMNALPAAPKTVALFLAARAKEQRRPSTLSVTLSAIQSEHERAGHASPWDDPLVKETWKGIRRRLGTKPKKKEPLSTKELRDMMDVLPAGLIGQRDRALLLYLALRRLSALGAR